MRLEDASENANDSQQLYVHHTSVVKRVSGLCHFAIDRVRDTSYKHLKIIYCFTIQPTYINTNFEMYEALFHYT